MAHSTLIRLLKLAIARGDRIATINLAQRVWSAGDVQRTEIVGMYQSPMFGRTL